MTKSKKTHPRASTVGKDVPSVWLPNPGGTVVYIAGGPPASASALSASLSEGMPTSAPRPSRKRKRGVNSMPGSSNVPRSNDTQEDKARSNGAENDQLVRFFTAAFKLLADTVYKLPDSEHKTRLSNILRSFSEVLPECEAPANQACDVNTVQ